MGVHVHMSNMCLKHMCMATYTYKVLLCIYGVVYRYIYISHVYVCIYIYPAMHISMYKCYQSIYRYITNRGNECRNTVREVIGLPQRRGSVCSPRLPLASAWGTCACIGIDNVHTGSTILAWVWFAVIDSDCNYGKEKCLLICLRNHFLFC